MPDCLSRVKILNHYPFLWVRVICEIITIDKLLAVIV